MHWLYDQKKQKMLATLAAVASIGAFLWALWNNPEGKIGDRNNVTVGDKNEGYVAGGDITIRNSDIKESNRREALFALRTTQENCSKSGKLFDDLINERSIDYADSASVIVNSSFSTIFLQGFLEYNEYMKIKKTLDRQGKKMQPLFSTLTTSRILNSDNNKNIVSLEKIPENYNRYISQMGFDQSIEKMTDNNVIYQLKKINEENQKICSMLEGIFLNLIESFES